MIFNKEDFIKVLKFALLFYAIGTGLIATVVFALFIFWVIPKDELASMLSTIGILAGMVYGTCFIALIIREVIKRKFL